MQRQKTLINPVPGCARKGCDSWSDCSSQLWQELELSRLDETVRVCRQEWQWLDGEILSSVALFDCGHHHMPLPKASPHPYSKPAGWMSGFLQLKLITIQADAFSWGQMLTSDFRSLVQSKVFLLIDTVCNTPSVFLISPSCSLVHPLLL